jgi:hypothetical protein
MEAVCELRASSLSHRRTAVPHLRITYNDFSKYCLCQVYGFSALMGGEHAVAGLTQHCLDIYQKFYIVINQKYAGRNHIYDPFFV